MDARDGVQNGPSRADHDLALLPVLGRQSAVKLRTTMLMARRVPCSPPSPGKSAGTAAFAHRRRAEIATLRASLCGSAEDGAQGRGPEGFSSAEVDSSFIEPTGKRLRALHSAD